MGRRLFKGENNADTLNRILNLPIPAPSEFVDSLGPFDDVLAKALRRDAEQRFADAEEFSAALEAAALASCGIATRREVSSTVRTWLGGHIEEQATRVREAIRHFGQADYSGMTPIPVARDTGSGAFVRDGQGSASEVTPSTTSDLVDVVRKPQRPIAAGMLLSTLLFAGGLTYWTSASSTGEERPPTTDISGIGENATPTDPAALDEPGGPGGPDGPAAETIEPDGPGGPAAETTEPAGDEAAQTAQTQEPTTVPLAEPAAPERPVHPVHPTRAVRPTRAARPTPMREGDSWGSSAPIPVLGMNAHSTDPWAH